MTIADITKRVLHILDDNSPLILTGLAVGGVVSTVILAIRATPTAVSCIFEENERRAAIAEQDEGSPFVELTKRDIVRLTWMEYIPTIGMTAITITCIIGAQSINTRRQAALISGFTLAETAFKEYREKVTERLGEKADQGVRDDIAKDHVQNNPVSNQVVITGKGDVLCYDHMSGHYFNCDMESLRRAQNDINAQCINGMYASQNDFYQKIGLPNSRYGEEYGWTTTNMLELKFSAVMSEDNTPCIAIDYETAPVRNYHKFH